MSHSEVFLTITVPLHGHQMQLNSHFPERFILDNRDVKLAFMGSFYWGMKWTRLPEPSEVCSALSVGSLCSGGRVIVALTVPSSELTVGGLTTAPPWERPVIQLRTITLVHQLCNTLPDCRELGHLYSSFKISLKRWLKTKESCTFMSNILSIM